jgi:hypothetical protein
MPEWKSEAHLEDHYLRHRRELPGHSMEQYDESARETVALGTRCTYRDRQTGLLRVGYFHRNSSRMTVVGADGVMVSHFRTDEEYLTLLPLTTYRD